MRDSIRAPRLWAVSSERSRRNLLAHLGKHGVADLAPAGIAVRRQHTAPVLSAGQPTIYLNPSKAKRRAA